MTGRELLEALLKMDPADLELEVVVHYDDPDTYARKYMSETRVCLERVTRREVPLVNLGKPMNSVIKVISIG